MSTEIKNLEWRKERNTVALIGMICSIVWLITILTIIWLCFWTILLIVWFILWIIWLFYSPRGKARVAIIIPAIIWIIFIIWLIYVKNSTPAAEFSTWYEGISKNELYSDIIKDDAFLNSISKEFKETIKKKSWDELKELFNNSNWSNFFEKRVYVFFDLKKENIENYLEKYVTNPDILDMDYEIIDEENDENIDKNDKENEDNNEDDIKEDEEQETIESETVEIFDSWEKSDIEEIIDILE